MQQLKGRDKLQTLLLATVWGVALLLGLLLQQLEIFLLVAPLSAGIYLLTPEQA